MELPNTVRDLLKEELEVPKQGEDNPPLAHSLSVRISWLNSAFENLTCAILEEVANLNMLEWRCLATLCIRGPMTGKEIARYTNVGAPQASRGLRALGARGYVEWIGGSEKRSFGPALVTEAGRKVYERIAPIMRRRNDWLMEELSEQERNEIFRLLAIIRVRVSEADYKSFCSKEKSAEVR